MILPTYSVFTRDCTHSENVSSEELMNGGMLTFLKVNNSHVVDINSNNDSFVKHRILTSALFILVNVMYSIVRWRQEAENLNKQTCEKSILK